MDRDSLLVSIAEREPLLTDMSIGTDLKDAKGDYLGIGISSRNGLTEHLPFDAMGMVLVGELVKRELDLNVGNMYIADEHARTNGFDIDSIDRIAKSTRDLMRRILDGLHFDNWEIVLGSEITKNPEHREILATVNSGNIYERMQLADMELYRRQKKGIKIGWTHRKMVLDEKHFDGLYRSVFGDGTTFVYADAGRLFDGTCMPPYLNDSKYRRLLLKEDEDLDAKVSDMPKGIRAYFNRTLDLFDRMVYGSVKNHQNESEVLQNRLKEAYGTIFSRR